MQSSDIKIGNRISQIIRWSITIGVSILAFMLIHFGFPNLPDQSQDFLALLAAISALIIVFFISEHILQLHRQKGNLQKQLDVADRNTSRLRDWLDTVKDINSQLAGANDETSLVQKTLSSITKMTNASGCSFVPFDEWGQPMPSFVYGDISDSIWLPWQERLASLDVRRICKRCQKLVASPQSECPLALNPFEDTATIHCFPLSRQKRSVGMFNLFMPIGNELDLETHAFIESLLDELANGLEIIRLDRQFMGALKQGRSDHIPGMQLDDVMRDLLAQLLAVINVPAGLMLIRSAGGKLDDRRILAGQLDLINPSHLSVYLADVLRTGDLLLPSRSGNQDPNKVQVVIPIQGQNKIVYGALFLFSGEPEMISESKIALLSMFTSQVAMTVEYQRMMDNLEFEAVIRERTRLAREIHDGIAQTLAYLKIQTGLMNSQLKKGDFPRLEQSIQANYQAIADAYNEVRQSIDNLRVTPQKGIQDWLNLIIDDFNRATEIKVTQTTAPQIYELSDEIQMQFIRIVQECLSNIRKHAHASHVWLTVKLVESDLVLEVRDNGCGFDLGNESSEHSHGLRGMQERAQMIGADLQITSQEGVGTIVRLQMSLAVEELIR